MKALITFLITLTFPYFSTCIDNPFWPRYELIYYCSFETSEDTTGWQGIKTDMFVADPAPCCGNKSLYIGGGCIQPAARIVLDSRALTGKYRLSCWGKKGEFGGGVKLAIAQNNVYLNEISIRIQSEEWKFYQSEGFFNSSGDFELRLELWVGGIIYNSMFIDGLKVQIRQ